MLSETHIYLCKESSSRYRLHLEHTIIMILLEHTLYLVYDFF